MRERRGSHKLGKRLVDGMRLRSAPPIDGVWISTFNLRWWQHVEHEQEPIAPPIDLHLVVR
jgi:hypothetical protein